MIITGGTETCVRTIQGTKHTEVNGPLSFFLQSLSQFLKVLFTIGHKRSNNTKLQWECFWKEDPSRDRLSYRSKKAQWKNGTWCSRDFTFALVDR